MRSSNMALRKKTLRGDHKRAVFRRTRMSSTPYPCTQPIRFETGETVIFRCVESEV